MADMIGYKDLLKTFHVLFSQYNRSVQAARNARSGQSVRYVLSALSDRSNKSVHPFNKDFKTLVSLELFPIPE
jgi:hypothetical protein